MSAQYETHVAEPAVVPAVASPRMDAEPFPWRQWAGVLAGGVAGFGFTVLLSTLGLAIGVASEPVASTKLGVGSAIWWILEVAIVGLFAGALVGAILSPKSRIGSGALAFLTWCVGSTILLFMLSIGAGSFLGGMGSYLSWIAQDPGVYADPIQIERAHRITTAALWVLFASQLVGIGMTLLGIRFGARKRATIA